MTKRKAVAAKPKLAKPLTADQLALRDALWEKNKARPARPKSALTKEGGNTVVEPAEGRDAGLYSAQMLEAFGTTSIPFLNATMDRLTSVMAKSPVEISDNHYNAAIALLASIEPENELEATLAAQMAAANHCAMTCMARMGRTEFVDQLKLHGDLANKFLRTFAAQTEALSKLRRGGEQVVKYIHVHEGGQAVVAGTINQGSRANVEIEGQPYGAETTAGSTALFGPDAAANGVPVPRDA